MFNSLKEFFENNFAATRDSETAPAKTIEFAAAVLMFEISRADDSIDTAERKVIDEALLTQFHMPAEDVEALLTLAEQEVDHSISLYDFTRSINDSLSAEDKIKIIDALWQVAFADAVLDKYEEYYVRKIADLLYVSHKDYIQSKHRAAARA